MSPEARKPFVEFFGGVTVCVVSCFRRVEISNENFNPHVANLSHPPSILSSAHPFVARCIVAIWANIAPVFRKCCETKVLPSIVVHVYVFVVNVAWGPFSCFYQPNDARFDIENAIYFDLAATTSRLPAPSGVDAWSYVWPIVPNQPAGVWFVGEDRPNILGRQVVAKLRLMWNVFRSHVIVPRSLWLGAAQGVGSALATPNHYQFVGSS